MSVAVPVSIVVFQPLFTMFDNAVLNTITTGSANVIALISPLVAAGFTIYMMLVLMAYWRGATDQPIVDYLMRFAAWGIIITASMNISYYAEYIVPFANGLGDDIANALTSSATSGTALDSLLSKYITAIVTVFNALSGYNIAGAVEAVAFALVIILVGLPFLAIAAAYIILAKFALGLLLAVGPMFIACALFPATRKFFEAWTAQCLNYAFLVALFAAAGAIEINFADANIPTGSVSDLGTIAKMAMMGIVFIVVSMNLPGLASALAGGVGISAMTQHVGSSGKGLAGALGKLMKSSKGGGEGNKPSSGGTISGEKT